MHPIQQYRLAKGWTRGQLAEQVGVNINSVVKWERGAFPRGSRLLKLSQVLGVDTLQLIRELEAWKQQNKTAAA